MQGKSMYKVPEGKLIKITLDYGDKINSVTINGDFFLHPEDGIEKIEQSLSGVSLETDAIVSTSINKIIVFMI